MINVTLLAGIGTLLMGCAGSKFATYQGAAPSLPQAQYQVLGKTKYDKTWIDKTTEAEVAGFGMKRPQRRPASFDTTPASHTVVVLPPSKPSILAPTTPAVVTVAPKKATTQSLRDRIKALNEKVRKLEGK